MFIISLKHGILGFLCYGDMTGYELNKAFNKSLNFFWSAQMSQIYRELNSMEKKGWLSSSVKMQTDKPNKKIYSLTDTGRHEFFTWLTDYKGLKDAHLKDAFLMKLFFSGIKDKQENIRIVKVYIKECENVLEHLAQSDEIKNNYSQLVEPEIAIYWDMTARHGEMYYNMCIDWAKEVLDKLEAL